MSKSSPKLKQNVRGRRDLPRIVVTMGDPAGIGPEIVLRAIVSEPVRSMASCRVVGDLPWLERWNHRLRAGARIVPAGVVDESSPEVVPVHHVPALGARGVAVGRVSAAAGRAALAYLDAALGLLRDGDADALVTAPVSKEAVVRAGVRFVGHTEHLAEATNTKRVAMMFVGGLFRLVLVTRHVPLAEVSQQLTPRRLRDAAELLAQALVRYFGCRRPRIAVCGLNPHAGEAGAMGHEEQRVIEPVLRRLRAQGWRLEGPMASDALFYNAYRGEYDGIVCMYHDQALIPLKMAFRDIGINVTLGLPFVRTSPDHGTAFDIAGKGVADPLSMMEAIRLAARMVVATRGAR